MKAKSIIVIGLPRSGTSLTTNLCISAKYDPYIFSDSKFFGGSPYNLDGYQEEVRFTLLNDQLIRAFYGKKYSFLFPPNTHKKLPNPNLNNFHYDINNETLSIPKDFLQQLEFYTGSKKDYWGLSRMRKSGKWHQAYQKFGVSEGIHLLHFINKYSNAISQENGIVIKDPRLCLTFKFYKFLNCKIIFVERKFESVMRSMKRHYGHRLFSKNVFDDFNWVSNHFNLQVPPITPNCFQNRYEMAIKDLKMLNYPNHTVNYDNLISGNSRELSQLESFLGGYINREIIKP